MTDRHPCEINREPYLAWHAKAARLHKSGARQKLCGVCGRFKYRDERCAEFKEETDPEVRKHWGIDRNK